MAGRRRRARRRCYELLAPETEDGRIRLDFVNPRPDELGVLITARRRRAK